MMLNGQVISYLISWVYDPHWALANIPQYVVFRFEVYRLVLSPLVNTQLISLVFAFVSFLELGKRLEHSVGSVTFGWLCLCFALIANIGFLFLSLALYALGGEQGYLMTSASGIWLILFGAIAAECIQEPVDAKRRFIFCDVPVRYYPVALFVLFAFLNGSASFAYAISMGAGYLYGQGKLDGLKLKPGTANEWEHSEPLSTLTSQPGFVYGHAALGSAAFQTPASGMESHPPAGSVIVPVGSSSSNTSSTNTSAFGGSPGHTLGSSASRRVTDTRAARLAALDAA
jgi:membrane associated rhomboid family serine protease